MCFGLLLFLEVHTPPSTPFSYRLFKTLFNLSLSRFPNSLLCRISLSLALRLQELAQLKLAHGPSFGVRYATATGPPLSYSLCCPLLCSAPESEHLVSMLTRLRKYSLATSDPT